jgi:hypothetical protein
VAGPSEKLRSERELQVAEDPGEDVADARAENGQNDDHDDSDQYQDEGILYKALPLFTWEIQHNDYSLNDKRLESSNCCSHISM